MRLRLAVPLPVVAFVVLASQGCVTNTGDAAFVVEQGSGLRHERDGGGQDGTEKNAETMPPKKEYELGPVAAAAVPAEKIWVTDGEALPAAKAGFEWAWTGANSETMPPKKEYELRPTAK